MSYTATLYYSTGFSGNNVPASVSVLESCARSTSTVELQIVQSYPLAYIDIPGKFDDYKMVDYVKVGDYVFQATPAPMPSNDGARLYLTFRGLTGSGGNFSIMQGVTARTTIHDDDTFGAYTQEDPLMVPVKPLQVDIALLLSDTDYTTVCVSAVDLSKAQETSDGDYTFPGKTFTDPNDPDKYVTTPYVPGNDTETVFTLMDTDLPSNPGTRLFGLSQFDKCKGLIRSLGLEGSVSLYRIPMTGTTLTGSADTYYSGASCRRRGEEAFDPSYATVKNKRVLYGSYNRWGLVTASGDKTEFNVEDILPSGYAGGAVVVYRYNDLRPDGCPYFRFEYYLGSADVKYFFLKSVKGAPWQNAPIAWTGASGSWIASYQHENAMSEMAASYQYEQKGRQISQERARLDYMTGSDYKGQGSGLSKISDPASLVGGITGAAQGLMDSLVSAERSEQDYARVSAYNAAMYDHNRTKELSEFGYSQSAVAPEISNPYQGNLIREMTGNGVIAYRYRYSDYDVKRLDKLLTMYGYAITRPVTKADILPDEHPSGFAYLECQAISLTSDTLPRWYLDLMEAEIESGVRIWWQRPDISAYEDTTT